MSTNPTPVGIEQLLLTPEQAAEVLNISRATVYDLLRLRALASVKIGRARRIPRSAVQEYVDRLVEEAA
jgi:excisionase family DNA binding protein